jgi:predicted small secreted protein
MVKKITALLALAGLVTVLGACNTIAGVGKDVEAAGSAVDKAATDTKKKM